MGFTRETTSPGTAQLGCLAAITGFSGPTLVSFLRCFWCLGSGEVISACEVSLEDHLIRATVGLYFRGHC